MYVLDVKALGTLGFRLGAPNVYDGDGDGDDDDGDDDEDDDDDDDDDNDIVCPCALETMLSDEKKQQNKKQKHDLRVEQADALAKQEILFQYEFSFCWVQGVPILRTPL